MFRYLSDPEFELVRGKATDFEGRIDSAGRSAAGVILGLHGLRCSEICGLVIGDLDADRGALGVHSLKHGSPRVVDLHPRVAAWLARLAAGRENSASLFRTMRGKRLHPNQFGRAWRRLSLRWIGRSPRFHDLRHTAAQRLWVATKDLWRVRDFLGHKSLTSTLIYVASLGDNRRYMPDLADVGPRLFSEVG